MWLADDDWIDQDYVERCLEYLEYNQKAVIAYGAPKYYRDGGVVCDGVPLSLTAGSPWRRVLLYYWHVRDNGMFYGIIRREVLIAAQLNNTFGGDWILMSEVVSHGHAVMVPGTTIHRSLGGMSANTAAQIRTIGGAGMFERIFPYIGLGFFAARNVMNRERWPARILAG